MSDRRLPNLAELPIAIQRQLALVPVSYRQWREDLRADHTLFWRTPAVRIAIWVAAGLVLLVGLLSLIGRLAPADADSAFVEATPMATLYVACTQPQCLFSFTTQQDMDFNRWPLTCTKCGGESVYRAKLCPRCRTWFATAPNMPDACPRCAARDAAKASVADGPKKKSAHPDDDEDDW